MTQPSGRLNSGRASISATAEPKVRRNSIRGGEERHGRSDSLATCTSIRKPSQSIPVLRRASEDTSVEAARRQVRRQYVSRDRLDTTRSAREFGSDKTTEDGVGCGGGFQPAACGHDTRADDA